MVKTGNWNYSVKPSAVETGVTGSTNNGEPQKVHEIVSEHIDLQLGLVVVQHRFEKGEDGRNVVAKL